MIGGRVAIAILIAVLSAACGSSPKTYFYTLNPSEPPRSSPGSATYSIVVGPVTVPETLDRSQIVLTTAANRVELSDFHRWAEPLKSEVGRAIAANLARDLDSAQVAASPQYAIANPDYQVIVDVQRFESVTSDAVTVDALWAVRRAAGGETRTGRSLVREPTAGAGYDAVVAAHGRALTRVSQDIAATIRTMR